MSQEITSTEEHSPAIAISHYDQMINKALSADVDIDKLQQLMKMKQDWEAAEAKKAFHRSMSEFASVAPVVLKNKKVEYESKNGGQPTSYNFSSLDAMVETVVPELSKYGLSHRWNTKQDASGVTVTCVITHSLGHSEEVSLTSVPDSSGGKNAIQSIGSTVSYLERYTFAAALGIASKDMDDDGQKANKMPETKTMPVQSMNELHVMMLANDALAVYLLQKDKDLEEVSALHYWPAKPKGSKGACRENAERMRKAGEDIYDAVVTSIENEDAISLHESLELATQFGKYLLTKDLGEGSKEQIKEILSQLSI